MKAERDRGNATEGGRCWRSGHMLFCAALDKVARSPKMPGQAQGRHVASIFEQREVGRLPTVGGEEGNPRLI